jgi:hypothetical protein
LLAGIVLILHQIGVLNPRLPQLLAAARILVIPDLVVLEVLGVAVGDKRCFVVHPNQLDLGEKRDSAIMVGPPAVDPVHHRGPTNSGYYTVDSYRHRRVGSVLLPNPFHILLACVVPVDTT